MAFCKNCGKELEEGSLFCVNCGQKIAETTEDHSTLATEGNYAAAPTIRAAKKRFHCPKCKGTHLQTQVQTDYSQSVDVSQKGYSAGKGCLGVFLFGWLGLLCGTCGQKQEVHTQSMQTTKSYWVCSECGHKFRHIDELENELATVGRRAAASSKGWFIAFGISLLIDIFMYTSPSENLALFIVWLMGFFVTVFLGIMGLVFYFDSKSASQEYWVKEAELKRLKEDTGYIE